MKKMFSVILAALAFIVGMLFMERRKEDQDVGRRLEDAGDKVIKDEANAKRRYDARIARAKEAAEATVADRPHTDDPVDDLRNRLDR